MNYELVAKLEKELDKLESGYSLQKEKTTAIASKQVNLNVRNKRANTHNDIVAGQKRKIREESVTANESAMDPFRRRETLPQIIWNTSGNLNTEKPAVVNTKDTAPAGGSNLKPKSPRDGKGHLALDDGEDGKSRQERIFFDIVSDVDINEVSGVL